MSLNVDIQSKLGAFELDVQLRTKAGTTVVFGRSGSGKTSLINAIAGLTTPDQGRIAFRDTVLFDAQAGYMCHHINAGSAMCFKMRVCFRICLLHKTSTLERGLRKNH